MLGTSPASIDAAEDREQFKQVVAVCGGESARSVIAHSIDDALAAMAATGDARLDLAGLELLLSEADLVKFARYHPSSGAMRAAHDAALRLVQETTPAAPAAPGAAP